MHLHIPPQKFLTHQGQKWHLIKRWTGWGRWTYWDAICGFIGIQGTRIPVKTGHKSVHPSVESTTNLEVHRCKIYILEWLGDTKDGGDPGAEGRDGGDKPGWAGVRPQCLHSVGILRGGIHCIELLLAAFLSLEIFRLEISKTRMNWTSPRKYLLTMNRTLSHTRWDWDVLCQQLLSTSPVNISCLHIVSPVNISCLLSPVSCLLSRPLVNI